MKIEIYTTKGANLVAEIFSAVENEDVKTWVVRKDANNTKYLTHKPEQWYDKALFNIVSTSDRVSISITWWKDKEPTEDIKGYYMGRFTELLLVNFKDKFGKFEIIK